MLVDPWLPFGFEFPDGAACGRARFGGSNWQIVETRQGGSVLLAERALADAWLAAGLLTENQLHRFPFGTRDVCAVSSSREQLLTPVTECRSPNSKAEALAFAHALRETRRLDGDSPLQDAVYVERFSRLLPTYSVSPRLTDDVIVGIWLTGGAQVSAGSPRRLQQMLSWLSGADLNEVLTVAGFAQGHDASPAASSAELNQSPGSVASNEGRFSLPGRTVLEAFFQEHIVDIVQNRERYRAMGVTFPSAVVLHGPPGCGKTFAVDKLIDFLGWPHFRIEASSVASPYIHETSRKVADVFAQAIKSAPAVIVIDEMDAFLTGRTLDGHQHHVEEVAEFLRRIPEATENDVLVIAMTNRLDMIDAAFLRRGRFDHIVAVHPASEGEVRALLDALLSTLPVEQPVDLRALSAALTSKPLSDVSFVVREAARLAAHSGKSRLDQASLVAALESAMSRGEHDDMKRRIGFM